MNHLEGETIERSLMILAISVPILVIMVGVLISVLVYRTCRPVGYSAISKPFSPGSNTVSIDMSSKKSTVSTYLDESQSTMKEMLEETYSGSGAGEPCYYLLISLVARSWGAKFKIHQLKFN